MNYLSSMTRGATERNARTGEEIRLEAEKAAFEGKTLPAFFNNLQARTLQLFSPETRIFAEGCYEKKLTYYVAIALIECAKSEEGRSTANEISRSNDYNDLHTACKPLVAICSKLLRRLKLEATISRLSRLSEYWADYKKEEEPNLSRRLKNLVRFVVDGKIVKTTRYLDYILEWTELYSIPSLPMHELVIACENSREELEENSESHNRPARNSNRDCIIVNSHESFITAKNVLKHQVENQDYMRIDVILGNEEDSVRFYKAIYNAFPGCDVQLNWRERKYGKRESPTIVVGTREYFEAHQYDRRNRTTVSAVILHAESNIEQETSNNFIAGTLDDYLANIFVLTTITMNHVDEIFDMVTKPQRPTINGILTLVKTWPGENQRKIHKNDQLIPVLDSTDLIDFWNRSYSKLTNEWDPTKFMQLLRWHAQSLLEEKVREQNVVAGLRDYAKANCSKFVHAAIGARAAVFGQDYVVYSERTSSTLSLRVRMKHQVNGGFGMQQFLELRHGCAMTPYTIANEFTTATDMFKRYDHVTIIHRSNPIRYPPSFIYPRENFNEETTQMWTRVEHNINNTKPSHSYKSVDEFLDFVETTVKKLHDYQIIIVCPTIELLNTLLGQLAEHCGNVFISETSLGVIPQSAIYSSEELVVCTTLAFFEGWKSINRVRSNVKIIVSHYYLDTYALEVACDLADSSEIDDVILPRTEVHSLTPQNAENSWFKSRIKQLKSVQILSERHFEPEELIQRHKDFRSIHDLAKAMKLFHKRLKHLSFLSKIVCSQLPTTKLNSVDSPMDIACVGFLENSRSRIEETIAQLRYVEMTLSSHGKQHYFEKPSNHEKNLSEIAEKHRIPCEKLQSFVRDIMRNSVDWNSIRGRVSSRFDLDFVHDAEKQWELYFAHRRPRVDRRLIALSPAAVSNSTDFLPHLRLVEWPETYRKSILQCSDRPLDGCSMYWPESGFDEEKLLELEGASIEYTAHSSNEFRQLVENTPLSALAVESLDRQCPLFLFPRRCYERLTKDLFDSGILICKHYELAEKQIHPYEKIIMPIIIETIQRSPLERTLAMESALMEYGSHEWMEWMKNKLQYSDYHVEVVRFYHRTIAERDYCVQDERLIQRLRDALTARDLRKPISALEQMQLDAFVYNTMDILQRGEQLVNINPPFASNEALAQLSHFIRAKRIPPPDF